MKKIIISVVLPFFLLASFSVSAGDKDEETVVNEEVNETEEIDFESVPPVLDPLHRHDKNNQVEFVAFGGSYLGDNIGQTWLAGGKLYYWFNNTIGFGTNYSYSKLLTNRNSPFGSSLRDSNMHALDGEVIFSNDVAMRVGESLIQIDFFGTLGVGAMYLNQSWELMGNIGGGAKFYTGIPWLAFRIDLNTYVHNVSLPGKDSIDFDMIITGGLSFMLPSRKTPYEQK